MNEPVTVKEEVIMATYKCEKCGMADTLSTKTTYYLPPVCHERTKGFYTPKCGAAQEMRVGPSESSFRSRFQITLSCAGKEPGW